MAKQPILDEIVALTDALLAVARSPHPDLDEAALLLRERGNLIAILPPPSPEERPERRTVLFQLQAADAELRARFEGRRDRVDAELRALAKHNPRWPRQTARPRLLDQSV